MDNQLVGTIVATFFENPRNFFKVLLVKIQEKDFDFAEKEIVVTGTFGQIQEGESYEFKGSLVTHPRYGLQFQSQSYSQSQPTSQNGLIAYFSSDRFPGIGKKLAANIVDALGEDAIETIIQDPDCLAQVSGLTEAKQKMVAEVVAQNHGMDKVIVGLSKYGFGSQLSFAIYQKYHNQALEVIETNPYQLVEDIDGIGFKRADYLASQLGIADDSKERLRAAVIHQLFQSCIENGNTYVTAQELLESTIRLLEESRPVEIMPNDLADVIMEMTQEGVIQQDGMNLYENSLFFSEYGISTSINHLLNRKKEINYPKEKIEKALRRVEKRNGITYGASQVEAIHAAITSPLFILTGGPGTGKTTVVNGIVQLFAELNEIDLATHKYTETTFPILLAAPTGRAAKRMKETTGLPSGTIHRLLGLNGKERKPLVEVNELEGGLLIVDEMSMVDTWLANMLFKSINENMQVILVGDKDQLPSVGPGQVLHDLLSVPAIPQAELTEIYRQGEDSSIIPLAHEIKEGRLPQNFVAKQPDRSFIPCQASQIEGVISQIVQKAKEKGFTSQDIQVLAPMYRGLAGIDALNQMMQEILNPLTPEKKEVQFNEVSYRIGDKVLQLVNSAELNVFNGDMGIIVGIIEAKYAESKMDELVIAFDSNEVTYPRNEWNQITLAYCCSIHKSQGSEFNMVILPMVRQYSRMLQRNLLYTAVTRSKERLILLGEVEAFQTCVTHVSANRQTTLAKRILEHDQMTDMMYLKVQQYEDAMYRDDSHAEVESKPLSTAKEKTTENQVAPEQLFQSPVSEPIIKVKESASEVMDLFAVEESQGIDYATVTDSSKKSVVNEGTMALAEVTKTDSGSFGVEQAALPEYLTAAVIQNGQIDPMIGMENISPYDFMK